MAVQPATFSRVEAARYVGVCPRSFDKLVALGTMPPALDLGIKRRRWSRLALDQRLNGGNSPTKSIAEGIASYDDRQAAS